MAGWVQFVKPEVYKKLEEFLEAHAISVYKASHVDCIWAPLNKEVKECPVNGIYNNNVLHLI